MRYNNLRIGDVVSWVGDPAIMGIVIDNCDGRVIVMWYDENKMYSYGFRESNNLVRLC
jgi:hypothetical protein